MQPVNQVNQEPARKAGSLPDSLHRFPGKQLTSWCRQQDLGVRVKVAQPLWYLARPQRLMLYSVGVTIPIYYITTTQTDHRIGSINFCPIYKTKNIIHFHLNWTMLYIATHTFIFGKPLEVTVLISMYAWISRKVGRKNEKWQCAVL